MERTIASVGLILSLSKGEAAALRLPKPAILRQAQDEVFGEGTTP